VSTMEEKRIFYPDIYQWVVELFTATGMSEEDAKITTDNLLSSDLRGIYSHGLIRLPIYIKRLLLKGVNPVAKPEVVKEFGATALMDGNNGMGQVVGVHAMKLAIEKARQYGTGYVSVRGSNHYGAAAHFARMALEEDMIGITTTAGSNVMAPWGGTQSLLSNNPVAVAIPADRHESLILDMAHSVVARGKILVAAKKKQAIPDTWGLAPDGSPTTDPEEALRGTLRPVGDYKGYGMALVIGILSGILPGGAFGLGIKDIYQEFSNAQNTGHTMQAVRIDCFMDPSEFKKRVDEAIDLMHQSPKAVGFKEILVPGEPEARMGKINREQGIPYPVALLKDLMAVSTDLGIAVPAQVISCQ